MTIVHIRAAQPGDEKDMAYIQTESWKAAFAHILDADTLHAMTDPSRIECMYRSVLEKGKGHGYILTLDGRGHCIAWWDEARDPDMEGKAELFCIHSLPHNWHKGLGSRMMDRVLKDVRKEGYTEIMLWVFTANRRAAAFYEANGFQRTGRTKTAFGAEETCYSRTLP
ncbi:MAG: GNAT family N-acetyltransferase [Solobacterium sp.]|nr:GNAT family N-acetyltransferase [Solobacterium sp.]